MRKLSVVMAALFLLGSAPAFAQTSGSTESGAAMGADGGSSETGATKKSSKKAKKSSKKKKASADAGM